MKRKWGFRGRALHVLSTRPAPREKSPVWYSLLCPFVCSDTPSFFAKPQTVSSHIKAESLMTTPAEKALRYTKIQAHALIHTQNTRSQNSGDYLSVIPEGLAFPRKSWKPHQRIWRGLWAATDLLSFPHILHLQRPTTTHQAHVWTLEMIYSLSWEQAAAQSINKWQL